MITPFDMFWTVVALYMWLATAVLCATVAENKRRSMGGWFFTGLLTGVMGLIAIAGMPARSAEEVEHAKLTTAPMGIGPALICSVLIVGAFGMLVYVSQ